MKGKFKILILITITFLALTGSINFAFAEKANITHHFQVTIDGKKVNFNDDLGYPELKGSRTMVPIRIISEDMGYDVDWDHDNRKVIIEDKDRRVEITIGDNISYVNGNAKVLDSVAYIKVNRTYVPLRFISESFGAEVGYEQRNEGKNRYHKIPISIPEEKIAKAGVYSGVKFDPAKDIMEDGRMTAEKTTEFLHKILENTRVYTENGKHYIEYKEVKVPDGWRIGKAFDVTGPNIIALSSKPYFNVEYNTIPAIGSFKKELKKESIDTMRTMRYQISVGRDGYEEYSPVAWSITHDPHDGTTTYGYTKNGTVYYGGDFDAGAAVFKDFRK